MKNEKNSQLFLKIEKFLNTSLSKNFIKKKLVLPKKNSFYQKKTHFIKKKLILSKKNPYYQKKTVNCTKKKLSPFGLPLKKDIGTPL